MLDRTGRDKDQRRRASRLWRQRQRDGEIVLRVPINRAVLDWLVERAHWISEQDAAEGDRIRLGLLVGAGLVLSAKAGKHRPDER
jgi:hypothetical protein